MDIKKAHRKSFDVEYVEVTEETIDEVAAWCGGVVGVQDDVRYIRIVDKNAINTRQTKAFVGDLVVHHLELKGFKSFGKKTFYKSFDDTDVLASHLLTEMFRSAETGQFVTEEFAEENPATTVKETEE
jgi:hypothetical protein